jgi:GDPmannose 4,6-dehydratase
MSKDKKKALICGVTGQDGAYLAKFLISKGYEVYGTSRDSLSNSYSNLEALNIKEKVIGLSMSINDFRSVLQVLSKINPDEVYNLSGQSSVGLSFDMPIETIESIAIGTINLLESIRYLGGKIKIYCAGSSECFGNTFGVPADEETRFLPRSPYGVAKSSAFWEVSNYREAYSLFACTGILFNHESPFRSNRFVTSKVISTAHRIANGSNEKLKIGALDIIRDWGWAPEYVEAMWKMLQTQSPMDFVIGTGESYSLRQFVQLAFLNYGLDMEDHIEIDSELFRPTDILESRSNPQKAFDVLGWKATVTMPNIVEKLVQYKKNISVEK